MILGPSELHADCVGCRALPQSSHGDILFRAFGAIDGGVDCALVGRRQAFWSSRPYDGVVGRSGAQT